jgi:hypothetical protein
MSGKPRADWLQGAAAALALGVSGCGMVSPTLPTVETIPSPTPMPFSAQAFLHATGLEATAFPSRYFSRQADFSMEVSHRWEFNQEVDTGRELDSISETHGGRTITAVYSLEKIGKGKSARDAMETFLALDWVADRKIEIMETGDFHGASGATWWRAARTLLTTSRGRSAKRSS